MAKTTKQNEKENQSALGKSHLKDKNANPQEKELQELYGRIGRIHLDCYALCKHAFGNHFENAGNIGIFCQSDEEFALFTKLREALTLPSNNPKQKYFELIKPIVIRQTGDMPQATYTHLYTRKPDATPYGRHAGDVDFLLSDEEYADLKKLIQNGLQIPGVRIYPFNTQDMIEIANPSVRSLAYVSTKTMAIATRVDTNPL